MKKIYLLLLFTIVTTLSFGQILTEDFESYTNGTGIEGLNSSGVIVNVGDYPSGVMNWSIDPSNGNFTATTDWAKVNNGQFEFRDVDGEVAWETTAIDITNLINVSFSIDLSGTGGLESLDYIDVFFNIDGNGFTRIQNWNNLGNSNHTILGDIGGTDFTNTTLSQTIGTASSLAVRVVAINNAGSEYFRLDNFSLFGETLSTIEKETTEFSVYPNPVTNGTVNITANNNEAISVSVFDVLGKQVLAQNVTNKTLNVSSLNAGMYILKLSQNGNSTTKKLVIK